MHRLIAALALTALVSACTPSSSTCDEAERKRRVFAAVQDRYLYQDLLPTGVEPSAYPSAEALLAALTAPAVQAGVDRGWDHLLTEAEFQDMMEGVTLDYGFGLVARGANVPAAVEHLLVKDVIAGSPAGLAGLRRGDELLEVGLHESALVPVAGLSAPDAGALLYGVLAPHVLRVLPRGSTTPVLVTLNPTTYDVDPVPAHWISGTTGYVQLRTFIPPAEDALRAVFEDFGAHGVQNVVVDLRYNGGGSVQTAVVLASLLSADLAGRPMFAQEYNDRYAGSDRSFPFAAERAAGTFQRVAFLTTRASASASELVPNVIDPYRTASTMAYVGTSTYGKPVGQTVLGLGCDTMMFLVTFRLQNSAEDAGYFQGLPDANSHAPLCGAPDDLSHDQDSADEAMTQAAVYFVEHGTCPPSPPALRAASPVREDHSIGRRGFGLALELDEGR